MCPHTHTNHTHEHLERCESLFSKPINLFYYFISTTYMLTDNKYIKNLWPGYCHGHPWPKQASHGLVFTRTIIFLSLSLSLSLFFVFFCFYSLCLILFWATAIHAITLFRARLALRLRLHFI